MAASFKPDAGFTRILAADKRITYGSGWVYGQCAKLLVNGVYTPVSFRFNGTGFKILNNNNSYRGNFSVTVDGVNVGTYNCGVSFPVAVVFEKLDLTDGEHNVILTPISYTTNNYFNIYAIDIKGTLLGDPYVIGDVATGLFDGYTLIDDANALIQYKNAYFYDEAYGYKGSLYDTQHFGTTNTSQNFNFIGTGFKVLCGTGTTTSNSVEVFIDGVSHGTFSTIGLNDIVFGTLCYQIDGLSNSEHTITLLNKTTSYVYFDALYIAGTLVDYNSEFYKIKTSIDDMETGDMIKCNFDPDTYIFSELGSATNALFTTPYTYVGTGAFYFRMVGYTLTGDKLLVADRNVINGITYSALNNKGFIFGVQVNIDGNNYIIRSLESDNSYSNNEYDATITYSSLNGQITPGDNTIWHWQNQYSYTTEVKSTSSIVVRGYNSAGYRYEISDNQHSDIGFRPVLVMKNQMTKLQKYSIKPLHLYEKSTAESTVSLSVVDKSNNVMAFNILHNGTEISTTSTSNIRTIKISDISYGINHLSIKVPEYDEIAGVIPLEKEDLYRTSVNRTFKSYEEGYSHANTEKLQNKIKIKPSS